MKAIVASAHRLCTRKVNLTDGHLYLTACTFKFFSVVIQITVTTMDTKLNVSFIYSIYIVK
jgi:hypothetical protein